MKIEKLLGREELSRVKIEVASREGSTAAALDQVEVTELCYDSREVKQGDCFFAIVGLLSDGHDYIETAIERGAVAVVCQRLPEVLRDGVCYIISDDVNRTMGVCSGNLYDHPSRELQLIGVTGTNGKTTTATLLADLFGELGYRTGLISTVTYRIADKVYNSTHTTPDAIRLNRMLREMVDSGCEYCFMEVSSHAIVQRRIEGLIFRGAIFSNLTHDHLDYHGTFAEYLKAKKTLFDTLPKSAFALINIDDRNGEVMVQNCHAEVARYSLMRMAEFRAKVVEMHLDGMLLTLNGAEVWAQILGRFNAYNIAAAFATARMLGFSSDEILLAISKLRPVSGRFEHFSAAGRTIIIDYAHTPDALEHVLETIADLRGTREGQQLITICGCGGDRDRTKRPKMAQIAYRNSSIAIFTSDNPRTEDPEAILQEMIEGVKGEQNPQSKWLKITSRSEAIATAAMLSNAGDIILIAGKGHETYQIIGTERIHFDDREVIRERLS